MTTFRRLCAVGLAGLIVGGVLSGAAFSAASAAPASVPAAVSTSEAFAGSASATAFHLNLLNLVNLIVSETNASADSTPKAHADAAVSKGSLTVDQTTADAPTAANTTFTSPQQCNTTVPIQLVLLLTGSCSQSAAAVAPSPAPAACNPATGTITPTACANASVLTLDVQLLQALQPLLDAVKNATQGLSTQVGQVLNNLPVVSPLLNNLLNGPLLGGLNIKLTDPVGSLITAIEHATELLKIQVLPSVSSVATSAGAVVASAESDGIILTVLPGLTVSGNPLLQVVLAKGAASATYNRSTCQSSGDFTAAGAQIKILDNPVQSLGTGAITLPLGLGTLTIGGGLTAPNTDGSVGSVADGFNLDLLNHLVQLSSGHAEAVAGGKCAVVVAAVSTTSTTSTTLTPISGTLAAHLATTGTDEPLLPIGFGLLLAGYLTRRSFLARRARARR
jgi:hypothetical protein